uniref:Uncharacterized protein n=1 Tax=Rhizophora mucronata TaxID=61149 RepID=A0A2P2LWD6_RHIMU
MFDSISILNLYGVSTSRFIKN